MIACGVALAAMATGAHAERLAVLPLKSAGDELSPPQRERLRSSLRGGLAAAAAEPIDPESALERSPALRGCETPACLGRLADLMDVPWVLQTTVEVVGSANFTFSLALYGRAQKALLLKRVEKCEICNAQEANEALSRAAQALIEEASRAPAGDRTAAGDRTSAAKLAGEPNTILLRPSRQPLLYSAIGLGVGGGLLLAGGIGLVAVDGRTRTEDATVTSRFDSAMPGGVLLGIGAAGVLTAAVLGYWSTIPQYRATASSKPEDKKP